MEEINLIISVIQALGNNKEIYNNIDEAYQLNKHEYYKAANEHILYNHDAVTQGSLIQEEYCKKILGILALALENNEKAIQQIYSLINKAYRWTYLYVDNHKTISIKEYINALIKKNRKFAKLDANQYEWNLNIMLFLAINNGNEFIVDEKYNEVIGSLAIMCDYYNGELHIRSIIEEAIDKKKDINKINNLRNLITKKYGKVRNIYDIIEKDFKTGKNNPRMLLSDYEGLNIEMLFKEVNISDRDINIILYIYIFEGNDTTNIEAAYEHLITLMYDLYFIKAYKQVKQMYFLNNKETMYIELEMLEKRLDKELNQTKGQLLIEKQSLLDLDEKYRLLENENERLKAELEQEKRNKKELNGLREFFFNMDNKVEYIVEKYDADVLKNSKAIIIGGHEKWQHKMKEHLPNFTFIHPSNLNFDIKLLDGTPCIYIYANYLNHAIYYKVMEAIEGKEIKIVYLNNQNEDLALRRIYDNFKLLEERLSA